MSATNLTNIIEPTVFAQYMAEQSIYRNKLIASGIAVHDPVFDMLAKSGGRLLKLPFWQDLSGDSEILKDGSGGDSDALTISNISASQDQAVLHVRGKGWGANDLAKAISGSDPMKAIADKLLNWWAGQEQKILISSLKGIFASNIANDSSSLVYDISMDTTGTPASTNLISGDAIIDADSKLGDASDKLSAIIMHSKPYARLLKNDLIDFLPDSEGKPQLATYMKKRVIVDDQCPVITGTNQLIYWTFICGAGAVAIGEGSPPVPVETARDAKKSEDQLFHRRHFILHPAGYKFNNVSIADESPSFDELEEAQQWTRVYNVKNIPLVLLKTNG